ncbi:DUF1800 domain-containing protein [Variovorax sp. J22G21]|uniref:DUF1800 domain-containing protein n=1 Tax=Variovorax fucosicus TaxID=3053517 RepID=UPI002577402E|nr:MULTISPECIES: DUF1800 domain-containing protein [unclassified Variovorax]MDM0041674.1 DUF1800 domain-containing protein [Variovorax sp. J22R193]MDM0060730.1 DUF1800 domain-containing protein [Variovorax sp. J22G21]
MTSGFRRPGFILAACLLWLAGCAQPLTRPELAGLQQQAAREPVLQIAWLDRVSWGATAASQAELARQGLAPWLQGQLDARPAPLPAAAQAQIDAMTISRTPVSQLVAALEAQRKAADALPDVEQKRVARQAYQQELTRLAREAQQRFLLRALYSPNQLQEQMTWFWINHFNVNARKANLRALIGDYEETAIRPHALGRFRDLLGATLRHPAMLRYLDNAQNANNRLNENYARELMELHTLGVDAGYSQADVQELARVLTGLGVREGQFEFNPRRHDFNAKTLLGQPITQRGLAEADEALDRLARAPQTARFISRKLAVYFVADEPPPALVDRMAASFTRSDGDIAATLATMFGSPEFAASLGHQFRDPLHYVVAGVRLAYEGRVVTNVGPMINWLNRMGEPLYGHETPDGYPLTRTAWASAGQMTTRFEIARAIGANGAVLFRTEDGAPLERPAFPPLAGSQVVAALQTRLGAPTREALAEAKSPQDWNTYLLASPEFMNR